MLDDVSVRMALLPDEALAWQQLATLAEEEPESFAFVDCTQWKFFECRMLNREFKPQEAVKHLLACVESQAPKLLPLFTWLFASEKGS